MDNVVQDVGCKSVSLRLGSRHDLVMMNRSLYRKSAQESLFSGPMIGIVRIWFRDSWVRRLRCVSRESLSRMFGIAVIRDGIL